jgi:glycogen operon protein
MYLNGDAIGTRDLRGQPVVDDHFLLFFNADGPCEVTLPPTEYAGAWDVLIDTGGAADDRGTCAAGTSLPLGEKATLVLREHVEEPEPEETDRSVAASLSAQAGTEAP